MSVELDAIARAVAADDGRGALEAALKAWRETRAPEFAELIAVISQRASKGRPAIEGASKAWHAAWLAVAGADDALDVDRLAPGLLREPLGDALITRVRQLAARPEDPRIVDAALAMVLEPPATSQGIIGKLWGPVFSVLETSRDSRLVKPLQKLLKKTPGASLFWPQHYRKVEKVLAGLPTAPKLDAATTKKLAALTKSAAKLSPVGGATPKKSASIAEQIVQQDHSADARSVAADALIESGDPRGIAIQLEQAVIKGTATPKQQKELANILKAHSDKWIPSDLRDVLTAKEYEFRLGFLDRAEVITTSLAQQQKLLTNPGWNTLRTLYADELALLTSPAFSALERVGGFTMERLYELGATSRALPVHTAALITVTDDTPNTVKTGGQWPALPKLRTLGLVSVTYDIDTWDEWEPILSALPAKELETLIIVGGGPEDRGWLNVFKVFPKLKQLIIGGGQRLAQLHRENGNFWLRIGVSDSRLDTSPSLIEGHHQKEVRELIAAYLPAKLSRVEIVDMLKNPLKQGVAKLTELVAAKQPVPVTHLPGSFPHEFSAGPWDLGNAARRRVERFTKAAKKRK